MRTLLLLLTLLFVCLPGYAEERLSLPEIPTVVVSAGTPSPTLPDGQYKCATVSQWKQVLLVGLGYQTLFDWKLEIQGALAVQSQMQGLYETALKNKDLQIGALTTQLEYTTLRLDQELSQTKKDALRGKVEKFVLYGVIVVEMVIIGIVGVRGMQVQ